MRGEHFPKHPMPQYRLERGTSLAVLLARSLRRWLRNQLVGLRLGVAWAVRPARRAVAWVVGR